MSTETIVIIFLLGFIIFREIREYAERQKLLDRLFARDLPELAYVEKQRQQAKVAGKMPQEKTIEI